MIQIDFGEAKKIAVEENEEMQSDEFEQNQLLRSDIRGSFVGTYNYMAPELIVDS